MDSGYRNLEINVRERILFTGISVGIRVVDLLVSEVTTSFRKRSCKVCFLKGTPDYLAFLLVEFLCLRVG